MFNETLHSPKTLSEVEDAGQLEAQHASASPHLSLDNVPLRMIGETGKQDPFDPGLFEEIFANGFRVLAVPLHSDSEGLDSPKNEEAVEGPWDRPDRVLQEPQPFPDSCVVCDRGPSYEVAVPTKVFRGAMHDNVCAVAQRVLQVRAHEGVVDNQECVRLLADLTDAPDVDYAH